MPRRATHFVFSSGGPLNPDPQWTVWANNDLVQRSAPSVPPLPAYLAPYYDPNYGTKLIRITGDPGAVMPNVSGGIWGYCVRHHYNLDQAWNADESVVSLITNQDPNCPITLATNAVTTSSNVLNFATNAVAATTISLGYTVADGTTPASIPGGTTVTGIGASSVTISNTVTVASGDTISFGDAGSPRSWLWLDGQTYAPLSYSGNAPPGNGDCRWHPSDPTRMIYVDGTSIGYFTPSTGATVVFATLTGYTGCLLGRFKGFPTPGPGPVVPVIATRTSDSALVMFAYNMFGLGGKSTDIVLPSSASSCHLSKSGAYIGYTDNVTDSFYVYDVISGALVQGPWGNGSSGAPSHADIGRDQNNDDVYVGGDRTNGGVVIKRRMSDGTITNLSSISINNYCIHTSGRATNFPLYCFNSYEGFTDGAGAFPLYLGELTGIKLDASRNPYRICHHFNERGGNNDFYAYTFASVSRSGNRMIFGSNWGNPNASTRPMYTFICDLR